VLVIIGLWQPARELVRKNEDYVEFNKRLLDKLAPELQYRLSKSYYSVVNKFLRGDFGKKGAGPGTRSDVDEHQVHSRKWLGAILQDAGEDTALAQSSGEHHFVD
jgi:hypothetical protein